MTSKRTIKSQIEVSFCVAFGLAVLAGGSYAAEQSNVETDTKAAFTEQVALSRKTSHFDLASYGDRFKLAIEAAAKEVKKPEWAWASQGE